MLVNTRTVGSGSWKALSLALAILIMCSAPAITAQKISRIQVANLSDKVQVGVTGSEAISYTVKHSPTGSFLAIDVKGYYTPTRPGRVRVGSDKVHGVKYGRFRPAITRIAFSTKGTVRYTAKPVNDGKQLLIDVWKSDKPSVKASAPTTKPVAAVKPTPKPNLALCMVPAAKSAPSTEPQPASAAIAPTVVMGVTEAMAGEPKVEEAEEDTPAPVVVAAVPSATSAVSSPAHISKRAVDSSEASADETKNISLDFHAADINDVLKALSMQSGKNIVTGTDVKGQVTVSLNKASLDEALIYVAGLSGYKYAKADQNTYLVGNNVGATMGEASDEVVMQAMTLRQISFDDALVKMLEGMFPEVKIAFPKPAEALKEGVPDQGVVGPGHLKGIGGKEYKLLPPKPLNTVLLTGPASEVAKASAAIQKMEDSLGQFADGSVNKVYRIKSGNVTQLIRMVNQVMPAVTVSWATDAFKLEGGDYGNQPDYIVITGPGQQVDQAIDLLDQVDLRKSQILIEAKVMDVANDALRDVGLDWSWSSFKSSETVNIDNAKGHKLDVAVDSNGNVSPINTPVDTRVVTRALALGPFDLLAKLNLMVTSSKAKLLANPKVAALEGRPADIFIGDQIKYIISVQNTPTGQNIQTETANVGIQLRTMGTVAEGDEITLEIHPEVSVISSFLNLGNGIALPQIASRFADSTVRMKSGQTVVIGGLIRDQDIKTLSKVPFLGDLPFLGQLFQHHSRTKNHSEVVIFITATVLKD